MKVPFHAYQKENGFWYWFDETKAESLPYKTREAAEESIERYRDCFLRPWTPGRRDRRAGTTCIDRTATGSTTPNRRSAPWNGGATDRTRN